MNAPVRSLCAALALLLGSLSAAALALAQVYVDDFNDNQIDPGVWSVVLYGSGAQIAEQNQELELFMPASASGTEFGARLVSVFQLHGSFDIQVDFSLIDWPYYNGMRIGIGLTDDLYDDYGVERSSLSSSEPLGAQEVYVADFGPFVLVPSGATQTGYYYGAGGWIPILTDSAPTGDITIQLHSWSHNYAFQHHDVRAAFDNFKVMSGELIWPAVPADASTWGAIKALYR
jgi:hypothetical protein